MLLLAPLTLSSASHTVAMGFHTVGASASFPLQWNPHPLELSFEPFPVPSGLPVGSYVGEPCLHCLEQWLPDGRDATLSFRSESLRSVLATAFPGLR